jgi:hypothetical protein
MKWMILGHGGDSVLGLHGICVETLIGIWIMTFGTRSLVKAKIPPM